MAKKHIVTGSFTGAGSSEALVPTLTREFGWGQFNVAIWGTWTGSIDLELSFDGGTTWIKASQPDLTAATFTTDVTFIAQQVEAGMQWRLTATDLSAGEAFYRLSQ